MSSLPGAVTGRTVIKIKADEKSQRKQIKKGEKIPVYGNKTIKFVVKDPAGKYGKTKSYTAIDESQRCQAFKEKADFFGMKN